MSISVCVQAVECGHQLADRLVGLLELEELVASSSKETPGLAGAGGPEPAPAYSAAWSAPVVRWQRRGPPARQVPVSLGERKIHSETGWLASAAIAMALALPAGRRWERRPAIWSGVMAPTASAGRRARGRIIS